MKPTKPRHTWGSGNVFRDLGVANPEAAQVKADLVHEICSLVADRSSTQAEAGKLLGIPQPKVSRLMGGRTDGFSTEFLIKLLNRLGQDVRIVVEPAGPGRKTGWTHVAHSRTPRKRS